MVKSLTSKQTNKKIASGKRKGFLLKGVRQLPESSEGLEIEPESWSVTQVLCYGNTR